jgi:heat-inducible transcriptional repressor
MLDERKSKILRPIVREYIETAQPVGSSHVASDSDLKVSPATIRNEMAVLEQEGYLRQHYTSAGRVPTDKAYRVYVDQIAQPGVLDDVGTRQVRDFFASAHGALERMLQHTTGLLSQLTSYTAVVTASTPEVAMVRSMQLVALSDREVMAVAVLSNGTVESVTFERDPELSDVVVDGATALLARYGVGYTLAALDEVPLPSREGGDDPATVLAAGPAGAARRAAHPDEHLYVSGTASVASAFDAVDVVRAVLQTLEQDYVVVSLLRDTLDRGVTVASGTEHGVEQLAACSVVVAPYVVEGEAVGTVGLLGPTRMNYPQALAAVDVVSHRLGDRLSDG